MALVVVDASVLIAQLDPRDALHDRAKQALIDHVDDDLRVPAAAYAEALVDPARAGRLAEAREKIALLNVVVAAIDADIAERAAALRASRRLRLPDAFVLASGDALDADVVLTGDRRWRRLPRVRVI